MRRPLIVGNWKMNLTRSGAVELARGLKEALAGSASGAETAVCPPSVFLADVETALRGSPISWGGQNMHHKPSGAFTGEISAAMLLDFGCRWVILGHSERRQFFHETDADVFAKTRAALAAGLTPIVCVGETLQEREAGQTAAVIARQFQGSLAGLDAEQIVRCVIAYEPVWAIGTGKVATPAQAEEVHVDLRKSLQTRYNSNVADQVRILYGGSVNAANAQELLSQPNIDGALVGGASLKAADFAAIVSAT